MAGTLPGEHGAGGLLLLPFTISSIDVHLLFSPRSALPLKYGVVDLATAATDGEDHEDGTLVQPEGLIDNASLVKAFATHGSILQSLEVAGFPPFRKMLANSGLLAWFFQRLAYWPSDIDGFRLEAAKYFKTIDLRGFPHLKEASFHIVDFQGWIPAWKQDEDVVVTPIKELIPPSLRKLTLRFDDLGDLSACPTLDSTFNYVRDLIRGFEIGEHLTDSGLATLDLRSIELNLPGVWLHAAGEKLEDMRVMAAFSGISLTWHWRACDDGNSSDDGESSDEWVRLP